MTISNDFKIFEALEKYEETDDESILENGILCLVRPEL